jgi:hypothetical protein
MDDLEILEDYETILDVLRSEPVKHSSRASSSSGSRRDGSVG